MDVSNEIIWETNRDGKNGQSGNLGIGIYWTIHKKCKNPLKFSTLTDTVKTVERHSSFAILLQFGFKKKLFNLLKALVP